MVCSNANVEYVTINGTRFVTCVPYDRSTSLGLALGLGLGMGIPILCLILWLSWGCFREGRIRRREAQREQALHQIITVKQYKRWESFIHHSGFIRRIAQVLDAEDRLPVEIEGFMKDRLPMEWEKIKANTMTGPFDMASTIILALFKEETKVTGESLTETIKKWRTVLLDKCGGEHGELIMDLVENRAHT